MESPIGTCMPMFLHEKLGLSMKLAALNAVLAHFIVVFIGGLVGGKISDEIAMCRPAIRLETSAFGLLIGTPLIACVGFAGSMAWVTIAMSGFCFSALSLMCFFGAVLIFVTQHRSFSVIVRMF